GNTNLLKQSYVNPLPGDVNNELASQLVALALNIRFDLLDPNFSPNSTVSFKDMLVDSGPMAGMTVMEVYNEGNAALSGCASKFTRALLRTFIAHINSSWSLGKQRNNVLTCPKDPCGKTWKDVTADGDFLQFGAYPNPSAGVLNIEFIDNNTHTTSIQLYDLTGKLVYTQEGQSRTGYNKVTLNLENLPKGVYMLRATVNLDTRNVRVILQ
ncbi:MAG TPA: T9SS type A sorting domain-containing protein, partial [Bacteroidia bacterium]|nr:T9SS type A sorting domain-containing protein [Bacteroidia bacterium]